MDLREKLLWLIAKSKYICANDYSDHTEDEYIADTLLDNGVTVQESVEISDELLKQLKNAPITICKEEPPIETVQELDGCEYCNGLPFSQMEDFTMPNASKEDYDIVTIRYCPICGRRLPQPPKGE